MPKQKNRILTPNILANFIQKQLDIYLSNRELKIWYDFINFFKTTAYNPNSLDARKYVIDYLTAALSEAELNNTFGDFVEKLAKAIHSIENTAEKSALKDLLIHIMDKTAKFLFQHEHFGEARIATKYADAYVNKKMAQEFKDYINWKISGNSFVYCLNNGIVDTFREKVIDDVQFEKNKICAQWAEYIVQKITISQDPSVNFSENYAENYQELLIEMSAILNNVKGLDDKLTHLILSFQKQMIERFIHVRRTPGVTHYHQCVIGFIQAESDKTNPHSVYAALQNIFFNLRQNNDVQNSSTQQVENISASSNSILLFNANNETQKAREEANDLLKKTWSRLVIAEKQMQLARRKRKIAIFQQTIKDELRNKLLASKVLSSGYLPLPQGNLALMGNGLAAIAENVIPVPVVAPVVGNGINLVAQNIDRKIQETKFNHAASVVQEINQIDPLVTLIAEKITIRYMQQIQLLSLESEADTVINAAKSAVTRVMEYIQKGLLKKELDDGNINNENIANILARAITTVAMYHGKIPMTQMSLLQSVAVSSSDHTLEEMFSCPGLVVIKGDTEHYYFNGYLEGLENFFKHAGLAMINKYGFMVGDENEANMRLLTKLPVKHIPATPHPARIYQQELLAEKNAKDSNAVAKPASSSSLSEPIKISIPPRDMGGLSEDKYNKVKEFLKYRESFVKNPTSTNNGNPYNLPAKPEFIHLGYEELDIAFKQYACSKTAEGAVQYITVFNAHYFRYHHAFLTHYIFWVEEAAKAGHTESLYYIGCCYYFGSERYNISQDLLKAKNYLRSALLSDCKEIVRKTQLFIDQHKIDLSLTDHDIYKASATAGQTFFNLTETTNTFGPNSVGGTNNISSSNEAAALHPSIDLSSQKR